MQILRGRAQVIEEAIGLTLTQGRQEPLDQFERPLPQLTGERHQTLTFFAADGSPRLRRLVNLAQA